MVRPASDPRAATGPARLGGGPFEPCDVHVSTGATPWTNEDSAGHTVTSASDNWSFDREVPSGGEASFAFDESGVDDVFCRFHGSEDRTGMSTKVGVGDATIEDPLGGSGGSDGGGSGDVG